MLSARYDDHMTSSEALALIRSYAVARRIAYATHARERMAQRNVTRADVVKALSSARTCRAGDAGKWVACGPDCDGDDLDVVVVIEAGLVVVTVY